jgi:hypothetical protein
MSALIRTVVSILAGFTLPTFAAAPVSINAEKFFTQLYEKTCLKESADLANLQSKFEEANVPELEATNAALFLRNKPGTVWVIPNVVGDYLVSINKSGNCSVYTHNININDIERGFIELLEKSAGEFTLEKVQDETRQTDFGPAHYISYQRTYSVDNSHQKFTLVTTTADGAEVQAQATVEALIN